MNRDFKFEWYLFCTQKIKHVNNQSLNFQKFNQLGTFNSFFFVLMISILRISSFHKTEIKKIYNYVVASSTLHVYFLSLSDKYKDTNILLLFS